MSWTTIKKTFTDNNFIPIRTKSSSKRRSQLSNLTHSFKYKNINSNLNRSSRQLYENDSENEENIQDFLAHICTNSNYDISSSSSELKSKSEKENSNYFTKKQHNFNKNNWLKPNLLSYHQGSNILQEELSKTIVEESSSDGKEENDNSTDFNKSKKKRRQLLRNHKNHSNKSVLRVPKKGSCAPYNTRIHFGKYCLLKPNHHQSTRICSSSTQHELNQKIVNDNSSDSNSTISDNHNGANTEIILGDSQSPIKFISSEQEVDKDTTTCNRKLDFYLKTNTKISTESQLSNFIQNNKSPLKFVQDVERKDKIREISAAFSQKSETVPKDDEINIEHNISSTTENSAFTNIVSKPSENEDSGGETELDLLIRDLQSSTEKKKHIKPKKGGYVETLRKIWKCNRSTYNFWRNEYKSGRNELGSIIFGEIVEVNEMFNQSLLKISLQNDENALFLIDLNNKIYKGQNFIVGAKIVCDIESEFLVLNEQKIYLTVNKVMRVT